MAMFQMLSFVLPSSDDDALRDKMNGLSWNGYKIVYGEGAGWGNLNTDKIWDNRKRDEFISELTPQICNSKYRTTDIVVQDSNITTSSGVDFHFSVNEWLKQMDKDAKYMIWEEMLSFKFTRTIIHALCVPDKSFITMFKLKWI